MASDAGANSLHQTNEELYEIVNTYCMNSVEIVKEFCAALEQQLMAINKFQYSLVHEEDIINGEASFEGGDSAWQDLVMQERSALHSLNNTLLQKLHCMAVWKKACAVFFTAATATSAAAAAANANSNTPAAAAAASAASILFGAVGKWVHSHMKKRESAVMKRKEIIDVVIRGARSSINYLSSIHVLGGRLLCEANSVLEMVDDDGAMEVDVRKKVAELNNIFQELRGKANCYGRNMNRATEAVLQSSISE